MIAHLRGREQALEPFGWKERKAEWIALACLHSGVFTRTQATRFLDTHQERARRLVHALIAQGSAAEETVPRVRGIGRVCRIYARSLYRVSRARSRAHPPPPHGVSRRAHAAPALARLCDRAHGSALACHGAREGRSVRGARDRTRIAARQGVPGSRRRDPALLPLKLPIALDSGRAMFVYVDPGHDTATALRSWGAAHRGLWLALHRLGRSVEVVAVARTSREMDRALAVMSGWAEASGPGEPDAGIREELARIERAILQGAVQILEDFGGLQAAMKRSVVLEKQVRRQPGPGSIRRASTWRTVRLAGARYR